MHKHINKGRKQSKESQTRWHKARGTSTKEAKHVITQRGKVNML